MTSKYTKISIYFPEDFEHELEMFKLYMFTDKNININQKYEGAKLFSLAIRYLIKEYNNYRRRLEKKEQEKEQKKENQLNPGDPSNAQTNSNQDS